MSRTLHCALALVVTGAAPVRAAAPVPDCVTQASATFQRGAFAEVVEQATRCWQDTRHPRAHYLVAMAHLALDQDALAVLALRRYLADDLTDEPTRSVTVAKLRLDEARARIVAVTLQISPPPGTDAVVKITAERPAGERPAMTLTVDAAALETGADGPLLRLDPGAWTLTVRRAGFLPAQQPVELAAGAAPMAVSFTLTPAPRAPAPVAPPPSEPPPPRFPTRPWLIASGVAGGVMVVAGAPLLAVGTLNSSHALQQAPKDCADGPALDECRKQVARHTGMRGVGAGLLGAGVGALAAGLTGLAPQVRARRIAWAVELGVGLGVAGVGAALVATGLRSFNAINTDNTDPQRRWSDAYAGEVGAQADRHAAGAGLLGAGVGLALGAGAGLLVQRLAGTRADGRARLRLEPAAGLRLRF